MSKTMPLAEVFDRVTGSGTGIEFGAYDASRAGPRDAPVRGTRRSAWRSARRGR